jgi:hypothetical protein
MSGVPWSTADDERLRALARSGLSVGEIAKQMRRNASSVRTRATAIKIAVARDRKPPNKASPSERLNAAKASASAAARIATVWAKGK